MNFPDRKTLRGGAFWLAMVGLLALYGVASRHQPLRKSSSVAPELLVSLPRSAQVLLAAGDRHLAANLAGFRVLVADTLRMNAADYAVQAKLQTDIAWLNPASEDNYYIAAALLPWNGQVDAAQFVLGRAADVRTFDYQPLFYLAFNTFHFLRDPATAAHQLLIGAERASDQRDQWALQSLAARWVERGYRTGEAAGIVAAMAKNAPPGSFRKYLGMRAQRLQDLAHLQDLARQFHERTGRDLRDLQELVSAGLIDAIPKDSIGFGYTVSTAGEPMLKTTPN